MARVHVLSDDLLFGSNLQAQLERAGHAVSLGMAPVEGTELVIADLTIDPAARVERLAGLAVPVLAYYSHVESDVRELAAGLALAVPRSRMAREAPELVARALATAP